MRTEKCMLAQAGDESKLDEMIASGNWHFERKWDGERGLLCKNDDGDVSLYNRTGKDCINLFPELLPIGMLLPKNTTLDGEIYVCANHTDKDKPTTAGRPSMSPKDAAILSHIKPASYMCFDVLHFDGKDLEQEPYEVRKECLARIDQTMIAAGMTKNTHGATFDAVYPIGADEETQEEQAAEIKRMWKFIVESGNEGMVAKRVGSTYQHARSSDWLKLKTWREEDFEVIGFTSEKREISALILTGGLKVNCCLDAENYSKLLTDVIRSGDAIKCADGTIGTGISKHYKAKIKYLNKSDTGLRFPILRELI